MSSSDDNPFAPPSEAAELVERDDSKDDGPLINASLNARFVNFLVDSLCVYLLSTSTGALFGLAGLKLSAAAALLVSVSARLTYLPFFEYVFNKTPGKWLTRTRVVRVDGGRPGFMQILGRTLARYVPFEPFSFYQLAQRVARHLVRHPRRQRHALTTPALARAPRSESSPTQCRCS